MSISAVVVVHNEEEQLRDCLQCLTWVDDIVILLDKCTDGSAGIAAEFTEHLIEGNWPLEGPRRHAALDEISTDWVLEVDADERITPELAEEIRLAIAGAPDFDYAMLLVDNYIGRRLVRYGWGGSFGKAGTIALFRKGHKEWGAQRVHPAVLLSGKRGPTFQNRLIHYVDEDISATIARFNRYTSARAQDLRDRQERGSVPSDLRRFFTRFFRCYVRRKGYREGGFGLLIALMAGLYPLISTLKARHEPECWGASSPP